MVPMEATASRYHAKMLHYYGLYKCGLLLVYTYHAQNCVTVAVAGTFRLVKWQIC